MRTDVLPRKRSKGLKRGAWLTLLVVGLIVIDQIIKVVVKTGMSIGESIDVFGDWFKICYVENEGMAFGMSFGGTLGKYFLTAFRLVIAGALVWWLHRLVKAPVPSHSDGQTRLDDQTRPDDQTQDSAAGGQRPVPTGVLVGLGMILAGAVGNIIDCLFYGLIWGEAPFMLGRVVDMFYFPIIDTVFPEWLPVIGGHPFKFFTAIFNFADSCVTCGALYLIFFHYKYFAGRK